MKKTLATLILALFVGSVTISSCTRSSKSCKANQKKIVKMRKSGQLNNF